MYILIFSTLEKKSLIELLASNNIAARSLKDFELLKITIRLLLENFEIQLIERDN